MLYFFESLFDFYPHNCLIMDRCMLSATMIYFIESNFFSSDSIPDNTDFFTQYTRINTCFFSKFSQCCIFGWLSRLDASFGNHDSAIFMYDTEKLSFSLSFTETDSSSAWIEPNKGGNAFFPQLQIPFFISFHSRNYRYFLEKRKKFA